MAVVDERWGLGSTLASVMFLWMAVRQYWPQQLDRHLSRWTSKLVTYVYPYVQIPFLEHVDERLNRSEAYEAIESYLGATCGGGARRLRAEMGKDSSKLVLSMDEQEEVTDAFEGATFWWASVITGTSSPRFSFYPAPEEKRHYRLTFHRRHRALTRIGQKRKSLKTKIRRKKV